MLTLALEGHGRLREGTGAAIIGHRAAAAVVHRRVGHGHGWLHMVSNSLLWLLGRHDGRLHWQLHFSGSGVKMTQVTK